MQTERAPGGSAIQAFSLASAKPWPILAGVLVAAAVMAAAAPHAFARPAPQSFADLVEEVAAASDLSKRASEAVVNMFFDCIVDSLSRGDKVELRGFGTFNLRHRRARIGRNPRTGERVDVPAKVVPYFKAGKELRELVNR